jgi:hypothetical protein
MVSPSALAVFMWIASSNLVGCSTGRSPAWCLSGSYRRSRGSRAEFVYIDHRPAELPQVWLSMASLHAAPVQSSEGRLGCPTLPFTTVEDDPDIAPIPKLFAQLVVPVQTAAGHDKNEHVSDPRGQDRAGYDPLASPAASTFGFERYLPTTSPEGQAARQWHARWAR